MMEISVMKEKIIDTLQSLSVCISSKGGTEWTVRCPYCGDSADQSHGHFAIHIDPTSDDWMPGHCLKCGRGAMVSSNLISDLSLYLPQDVEDALMNFNKRLIRKNRYVSKDVPRIIPSITESQMKYLVGAKIEYISRRLGIPENTLREEAPKLRLVTDLLAFCNENHIIIPNKSPKAMLFLNFNYVGFLSSNGNCITLRRFRDETDSKIRRYDKLIIDQKNLNGNTFYNLPLSYDIRETEFTHVHIAEGIFDILSVYYNVQMMNDEHHMYFACCGYGYPTIIKYLLSNGIMSHLIVHLYADNDKSDDDIRHSFQTTKFILSYISEIWIHRNSYTYEDGSHEKDFGVHPESIHNHYYRIVL